MEVWDSCCFKSNALFLALVKLAVNLVSFKLCLSLNELFKTGKNDCLKLFPRNPL